MDSLRSYLWLYNSVILFSIFSDMTTDRPLLNLMSKTIINIFHYIIRVHIWKTNLLHIFQVML